ncbi:MAG TPA: AAA family ATPase [Thiobacillus sp.]
MPDFNDELNALLDARFPILISETHEEPRLLALIGPICNQRGMPLFVWSHADGLKRTSETGAIYNTSEFTDALKHVDATPQNGLYVFMDAHPFFNHPLNVRLIREIAFDHYRRDRTLLFVSPSLELPPELARASAYLNLPGIDADRVRALLKEELDRWQRQTQKGLPINRDVLPLIVHQLAGMGEEEAQRLIRQAIHTDGELNLKDLQRITQFKQRQQTSVLEMALPDVTLEGVGGFMKLKSWVKQRQAVFQNPALAPGLPVPKGIMLLGVQGAGKSLAAKAIAGSWKLPLLRLDFSALYNKYIGETEKNLRKSLAEAERMAPCLLWMDEIEKGLSVGDSDDGTSQRIIGTLLTWMSERETPIFMVATANDVSKLPPEFLRKGRFDELFFVDLPDRGIRETIFRIHLDKRQLDLTGFQTDRLAETSDGFSGAEIEQAIVAAQYAALSEGVALSQTHVEQELAQTRPLSVIRAEDFQRLRGWAQARCVMVD